MVVNCVLASRAQGADRGQPMPAQGRVGTSAGQRTGAFLVRTRCAACADHALGRGDDAAILMHLWPGQYGVARQLWRALAKWEQRLAMARATLPKRGRAGARVRAPAAG